MNYAAMATKVQSQLAKFGRTIAINRYAPSRNGSTGVVSKGSAELTAAPYAVELPAAKGLAMFEAQLKGATLTLEQLRFFVLEAVGQTFAPLPLDEVTVDGATWVIKGGDSCSPATVPLTYNIMVGK